MAAYFLMLVLIYALPLVVHMLATGPPQWRILPRLSENGQCALETVVAILLFLDIVTIRSIAMSDFIYFKF